MVIRRIVRWWKTSTRSWQRCRSTTNGEWLLILPLAALVVFGIHATRDHLSRSALMQAWPQQLEHDAALARVATGIARPIYLEHCRSCHGQWPQTSPKTGVPALPRSNWLYGNGRIEDLERTILYGIRSGHPKAHNVTDMPAEGRLHQLAAADVADVVEFLLQQSGQPFTIAAAERGRSIYLDRGNCYDCHAADARGNPDYGAPSLHGPDWIYGADRASLYASVYDGRHGVCPAWSDRLSPVEVRALAVYLYQSARQIPSAAP